MYFCSALICVAIVFYSYTVLEFVGYVYYCTTDLIPLLDLYLSTPVLLRSELCSQSVVPLFVVFILGIIHKMIWGHVDDERTLSLHGTYLYLGPGFAEEE